MFNMFPLLTLSLLIYAVLSMTTGSGWVDATVIEIMMISDEVWVIEGGDLFLAVALALLFIEILRATETGTSSIINHVFSALLFVACLLCFMTLKPFATSTFFLLTLMTGLDFMAGFIVTTLAARRDFGVSGGLSA